MPPMRASDRFEPSCLLGRPRVELAVLPVLARLLRVLAVLVRLLTVLPRLLSVLRVLLLLAVIGGRLLAVLLLGRRVLLRRRVRLLTGRLIRRILLRRVGGRLPVLLILARRRLLPGRLLVGRVARRLVLTRPGLRLVRSLRSAHRVSLKFLVVADPADTLHCINSHDASSNVVDSAFRSGPELGRRRGVSHLVEPDRGPGGTSARSRPPTSGDPVRPMSDASSAAARSPVVAHR